MKSGKFLMDMVLFMRETGVAVDHKYFIKKQAKNLWYILSTVFCVDVFLSSPKKMSIVEMKEQSILRKLHYG